MVRPITLLMFCILLTGTVSVGGTGNQALAFNTYKNCYNKCVRDEDRAIQACRKELCAKEKKKSRKAKCNSSCFANGEMRHKYCKNECARGETCLRSKKTKACLKTCEPDRKSNIRGYLACKKDCTGKCSKW